MKRRLWTHLKASALVLPMAALVSCTFQAPRQSSILVVAVEEMGFNAFSCEAGASKDEEPSGFDVLCDEAVRFTHAYTPSLMSQATLTSILTAKYPHDHGVRNNGGNFLSARFETAAELALQKGFRTSYFGGGPPVFRNSGLNQGFEIFDDNVMVGRRSLFRPAIEGVRLFLSWRADLNPRQPFFSILHFADPQFIDAPTVNDLGEVRGSDYGSQIEEVGESLGTLFRELKRQGRWDETNVIVMGLNGHAAEPRIGESRQVNLYSERTRVALYIKPARRSHEGSFNWKVDAAVSLVDVGVTLFELLGKSEVGPVADGLKLVSLRSIFHKPEPDWPRDRLILSETDWPQWRGIGQRRLALRKGPVLYLHDRKPKVFNTLTDSMELVPLPENDPRFAELLAPFHDYTSRHSSPAYAPFPSRLVEKLQLAQDLWSASPRGVNAEVRLKALAKTEKSDQQLVGWRGIIALRQQKWRDLKEAGLAADQAVWTYVAARNANEKEEVPADTCFRLFVDRPKLRRPVTLRECPSQELLDLLSWTDEKERENRRQLAQERFLRVYADRILEDRIAEQNQATALSWDISPARPEGPRLADLILALPEYKRFRSTVARRLADLAQASSP